MPELFWIECLDCGHRAVFSPTQVSCEQCGGSWLEARYDLARIAPLLLSRVSTRPNDLWRYQEILPVSRNASAVKYHRRPYGRHIHLCKMQDQR